MNLELSKAEFEHIKVTLEGAAEEFEELMREHDYFTTEMPDRLASCLEIVGRAA
jgi:hypothetical protein